MKTPGSLPSYFGFRNLIKLTLLLCLTVCIASCGIPWKHLGALKKIQTMGKEFRAGHPYKSLDIAYTETDNDMQKLDVYWPEDAKDAPVIVFVHGGFWMHGHRADYSPLAKTLTAKGYVTVLTDYRMHPEVTYPAFVTDTVNALNWVVEHIGEYGGDADKIILAGHSAGAQIVAQLATDETFRKQLSFDIAKLKGVAPMSGPFDFDAGKERDKITIRKVMETPQNYNDAQPKHYVRGDVPPFLVLIGEDDNLTPPEQAEDYALAMGNAGADVRFCKVEEGDHYTMMLDMVPEMEGPALDTFLHFAACKLNGEAPEAPDPCKIGCGAAGASPCSMMKKTERTVEEVDAPQVQ